MGAHLGLNREVWYKANTVPPLYGGANLHHATGTIRSGKAQLGNDPESEELPVRQITALTHE